MSVRPAVRRLGRLYKHEMSVGYPTQLEQQRLLASIHLIVHAAGQFFHSGVFLICLIALLPCLREEIIFDLFLSPPSHFFNHYHQEVHTHSAGEFSTSLGRLRAGAAYELKLTSSFSAFCGLFAALSK